MSGDGTSQGDDFEERARRNNSTLQGLIDTISSILAASRELLARLQGNPPKDDAPGQGAAPEADRPPDPPADEPDAHRLTADATAPAVSELHLHPQLAG